jgi:hypothetical protein
MIRVILILFCFLSYGNFSPFINNLIIFLLINIGLFSILRKKKLNFKDFNIFILSTFIIELFLGFPLLISVVALSIPLLALSYFVNNFSVHYTFTSIFLFILSSIIFFILYPETFSTMRFNEYLLYFFVLIFINFGFKFDGKKQS